MPFYSVATSNYAFKYSAQRWLLQQQRSSPLAESCQPGWLDGLQYVHQAPLSSTISWNFLTLLSIELVMLSNHLILCRPLLLLPSIFPSITVFSSESALHIRWPKYWSFNISPSSEYSGLISFRIDWFDLAFQGTLKSLLQCHSLKASILWCLAFFIWSNSYIHTWLLEKPQLWLYGPFLIYSLDNASFSSKD